MAPIPRHRSFSDSEGWLERFQVKARDVPSKCCAACRKGTPTHPGGCQDPQCTCHTAPPRKCTVCGRSYSAIDMPFHVTVVHDGKEGSRYE